MSFERAAQKGKKIVKSFPANNDELPAKHHFNFNLK